MARRCPASSRESSDPTEGNRNRSTYGLRCWGHNDLTFPNKSLFPHLRVFSTEKEEFTDFVHLASEEPFDLNPAGEDRAIRWLLDHEHMMNRNESFTITDEFNPMETIKCASQKPTRNISSNASPSNCCCARRAG